MHEGWMRWAQAQWKRRLREHASTCQHTHELSRAKQLKRRRRRIACLLAQLIGHDGVEVGSRDCARCRMQRRRMLIRPHLYAQPALPAAVVSTALQMADTTTANAEHTLEEG